jgi:hypothetical protein
MFTVRFLTSLAATLGAGVVWDSSASAEAAPTVAAPSDSRLLRLLRFAPRDAQVVEYGNLIGLKQAIGAKIASLADVPVPPDAPDASLTARQEIGRAWWWDFWTQIPKPALVGNNRVPSSEWDHRFGFNLFDVDDILQVGDAPGSYSVVEGSIDPAIVGARLRARGFSRALSPLGQSTGFYIRGDAYDDREAGAVSRQILASCNRVIASPGVLIAGPATKVVSASVRAVTGQAPSLADDPEIALLAASMDDPSLLPGTSLLGATLLGRGAVERVAGPGSKLRSHRREPFEQLQGRAERAFIRPPLLPYSSAGLGYRRGRDLGERYWLFTLLYPNEAVAREAGTILVDLVSQHHSRLAEGPLVGTHVDDVLPPVIRSGPVGATVSVMLRAKPRRDASWMQLFSQRDLGFLEVGQSADLCLSA